MNEEKQVGGKVTRMEKRGEGGTERQREQKREKGRRVEKEKEEHSFEWENIT